MQYRSRAFALMFIDLGKGFTDRCMRSFKGFPTQDVLSALGFVDDVVSGGRRHLGLQSLVVQEYARSLEAHCVVELARAAFMRKEATMDTELKAELERLQAEQQLRQQRRMYASFHFGISVYKQPCYSVGRLRLALLGPVSRRREWLMLAQ